MNDHQISKKKQTIKEIKDMLASSRTLSDEALTALEADERAGVKQAVRSWKRQAAKQAELLTQFETMQAFENRAYEQGASYIAGVDEVGRGPLAGPVVSAAVILPPSPELIGINDSKQLSLKEREYWVSKIREQALAISYSVVPAEHIDRLNIYQATRVSMTRAVTDLSIRPDHLLIDAMQLDLPIAQEKIIKGDARSISIAAASIIAKVTRDELMSDYDTIYPGYGFGKNAGYGTKQHLEGLEKYGPTPIHRRSFKPVSTYF